ncbi:MAG: class I SAM-dependent methyltransferase [Victivallales bacterium]|nr:class I SAM-dependent methyltransferase [Victivallales bacterium]
MTTEPLTELLDRALTARSSLLEPRHETAFRLFNGFTEGEPRLVIDIYAATALIGNYADPAAAGETMATTAAAWLKEKLPWLRTIVLKTRNSQLLEDRNGLIIAGDAAARRIRENGVWYAVDLCRNRDAGFFSDTRHLREWLKNNLAGKTVLNTFAYTGSLGIAALAGGAARVVQTDLSRNGLNQAKTSCSLNGFPIDKKDFLTGDFFRMIGQLKRRQELFDCVIIDPPFFASGHRGTIDLEHHADRLINKVRPLVKDGGYLVCVNNALYLSGQEYLAMLEQLGADGYLEVAELIPVPSDFTVGEADPARPDPAPFNDPTKIAVLKVRRKSDGAEKENHPN